MISRNAKKIQSLALEMIYADHPCSIRDIAQTKIENLSLEEIREAINDFREQAKFLDDAIQYDNLSYRVRYRTRSRYFEFLKAARLLEYLIRALARTNLASQKAKI